MRSPETRPVCRPADGVGWTRVSSELARVRVYLAIFHLHLSGNLSYSAFCHCREHAIGEVRKIGVVIRYGVGSAMVFGSRFMVTAAAAVTAEVLYGVWWLRPKIIDVSWLALLAFALIVIPNFSLQLGIARCTALAINTIRALGPVFVSAAQQLSDWLSFSGATLVCVLIFAISTALTSGLCARDELWRD